MFSVELSSNIAFRSFNEINLIKEDIIFHSTSPDKFKMYLEEVHCENELKCCLEYLKRGFSDESAQTLAEIEMEKDTLVNNKLFESISFKYIMSKFIRYILELKMETIYLNTTILKYVNLK
ncbi:MAG: hypothetical protein R3Y64_11050 [Peptostreptococcaceae bacterium]